jgi:hypothetical protein
MKRTPVLFFLSAAALIGPAARAEVRTFAMEGSVSYKDDPLNMLKWVNVGDRMVYTFSFDSEAPDTSPLTSGAEYGGLWATLGVGDTQLAVDAPDILIGHPSDIFRLHSLFQFGPYNGDAFLTLADQGAISDALTDVSLPSVPYDLAPWALKYFDIGIYVPQTGYPPILSLGFFGDIDSFHIVPEPATLVLLIPTLLMLGPRLN